MKLKLFIYFLFYLFVVCGIFVLISYYELPTYFAVAILLSILAIVFAVILVKRYLLRRKNREFVKRVVSEEKGSIANNDKYEIKQNLEYLFMNGINRLKNSSLKKQFKDPVYAYPWVAFLGDEESGKTEFLKNSNLTTSLTDVEINREKRNFNWWFFEKLVVLDISGKYANIKNNVRIENEWEVILEYIAKFREEEPLNGLVVTISVDSLMGKDIEKLTSDGIFIRKRINQLMKVVGANFPIYIMVTKLDKILGFNEIVNQISAESLSNSLGYVIESFSIESNDSFQDKLIAIMNIIKDNLLKIVIDSIQKKQNDLKDINQFINEFEKLSERLVIYIQAIFKKNHYHYMPKFRGIHFSSSSTDDFEIKGSEYYDKYIKGVPVIQKNLLKSFVDKFISKNLVEDRYIFDYLDELVSWKRVMKGLWIIITILVMISLSLFTYFSYQQNKKILVEAQKISSITSNNIYNLENDIYDNYESYVSIKSLESELNSNLFTNFGYPQAKNSYELLRDNFNTNFYNKVVKQIDYKIESLLNSKEALGNQSNFDIIMDYLVLNIGYYNKLKNGENSTLKEVYKKNTENIFRLINVKDIDSVYKFLSTYEQYLKWTNDNKFFEQRYFKFQEQFVGLLDMKKRGLLWLLKSNTTDIDDITLDKFWQVDNYDDMKKYNSTFYVSGLYTKEGKKKLEEYINTIKLTIVADNTEQIDKHIEEFWKEYDKNLLASWKIFLSGFYNAINNYNMNLDSRSSQLLTMVSHDNPFEKLLHYAAGELEDYKNSDDKWVKELLLLNEYVQLSKTDKDSKTNETIMQAIKSKLLKSGANFDSKYAKKLNNAVTLADYFKALNELSILDSDVSTDLQKFFSFNKRDSKLEKAHQLLNKFTFEVQNEIKNEFIFDFLKGPFFFTLDYAIKREGCFLNDEWLKQVSYSVKEDSSDSKKLFDMQNGYVTKFVKNYLEQYLEVTANNYRVKVVHNKHSIPFTSDFINYVNQGFSVSQLQKDSYKFKFQTLPMSTNSGSSTQPISSNINVSCFENSLEIENINFKNEKSFDWTKDNCTKATVKVSFDDFELIKTYDGKEGFVNFVNDIKRKNGQLSIREFDNSSVAQGSNIDWINIGLSIEGDISSASKTLSSNNRRLPQNITRCSE